MLQEEITMMAQELIRAELDYRLERARSQFGPSQSRHRVRRRRALHLPHGRRRPLSLA